MVSIIMPVYNTEKYLKVAIESILSQSYTDFELICVNDGSTDECLSILREYEDKDKRIKIINNKINTGAGSSRNIGLKIAKGEYISMLDSDDVFDSDLLKESLAAIVENNADIAFYDTERFNSEDIKFKVNIFHSKRYIDKFCSGAFNLSDCNVFDYFFIFESCPWNKLYKAEFLKNTGIWFYQLPWNEDTLFCEMTLMLAQSIVRVNTGRIMAYGRVHDSATRISNNKDPWCSLTVMELIAGEMKKYNLWPKYFNYFYLRLFKRLSYALRYSARSDIERLKFFQHLQLYGFDNIVKGEAKYLSMIDEPVKKLISDIKTSKCISDWQSTDRFSNYCLEVWNKKIKELFIKLKKDNKRIAMWGISVISQDLIQYLADHKLNFNVLIDRNPDKIVIETRCVKIEIPENAIEHVDVVLFLSPWIYEQEKDYLEKFNVQGLLLIEYLPLGEYLFRKQCQKITQKDLIL